MLSIFVVVVLVLAVIWKMIGYESSAPLTEAEVDSRLKEILGRLVNEISVNNVAFGSNAPAFSYIADSYHRYEKRCQYVRENSFGVYGLNDVIREIALAVCQYKIEVKAVSDYDHNFYDELNRIHKELNKLAKSTRIVRF